MRSLTPKERKAINRCTDSGKRMYSQSDLNAALAQRTREAADTVIRSGHDSRCASLANQSHIDPDACDCGTRIVVENILALIKPDESAALAERDRRVRLSVYMNIAANYAVAEKSGNWLAFKEGLGKLVKDENPALRGTGEEERP